MKFHNYKIPQDDFSEDKALEFVNQLCKQAEGNVVITCWNIKDRSMFNSANLQVLGLESEATMDDIYLLYTEEEKPEIIRLIRTQIRYTKQYEPPFFHFMIIRTHLLQLPDGTIVISKCHSAILYSCGIPTWFLSICEIEYTIPPGHKLSYHLNCHPDMLPEEKERAHKCFGKQFLSETAKRDAELFSAFRLTLIYYRNLGDLEKEIAHKGKCTVQRIKDNFKTMREELGFEKSIHVVEYVKKVGLLDDFTPIF